MRKLSLLLLLFIGITPSFAADNLKETLTKQVAIDKFVDEAPLFIEEKSLIALRKLAPLKFEGVEKIPNQLILSEPLEYKTLEFDGLSIFGLVQNQSELPTPLITITDEKWKILNGLNVGTDIERVEQVLGKATYAYGDIKEYCGETHCVLFHTKGIKIIKIVLFYDSEKEQPPLELAEAEHIEGVYIPKDLEEVWAVLEKKLSVEDRQRLKDITEDDMISFHFSRGMGIRNSWGLWRGSRLSKYFNDLGIHHPDDMSGIILKTFWCHINNKPIRLEERIAFYKEFWLSRSEPPSDTFPEQSLKQLGAQDYDTPKGRFLGFIQIYRNKKSGNVWLYEYNKGWELADDEFFNKYPHWKDNLAKHP